MLECTATLYLTKYFRSCLIKLSESIYQDENYYMKKSIDDRKMNE